MPINVDLLIAAPMLQDAFVDKDGTPMAGGVVTCYRDNSRTTLKNWYYQSGTPGNYTYVPLPNPLTLSAAGTICDINGVDTIPFFYPYSELDQNTREPYYITIVNHAQTNQITRANFPFLPTEENQPGQGSHENYIINNVFWRNIGSANLTNVNVMKMCPSQHATFTAPDINFVKNALGNQDTVTFTPFPLQTTSILEGDPTPEFYLNHNCATSSAVGETQKGYLFPITLHLNTLASFSYTFTIQAQNVGGSAPGQNVLQAYFIQDTGTGTTIPPFTLIGAMTLNSAWTKYEFSGVTPSTSGLSLSQVGDDALYLYIQVPLNTSCSINFTKPSFYLSNDPPTNSFATYDQIDSVVNTPRTGDVRMSLNIFQPYGWVIANDGTIGSAASGATTRANVDTWPLYNTLWSNVSDTWAPVSGGRGVSAYADFVANKTMGLPKTLSRVLGAAGAGAGLTPWSLGQNTGTESQNVTLTTNELPSHNHPGSSGTYVLGNGGGGTLPTPANLTPLTTGPVTVNVAPQGLGLPFNVSHMQPSVFYNVFFKL